MKQTAVPGERAPVLGLAAAVAAFVIWGVLPVYWKAVDTIAAHEIVSHRIVWTMVAMGMVLTVGGRWGEFAREFAPPSRLGLTLARSLFLAGNWLLFIWGVNNGRLLEISMGYFCSPLVAILLGWLVLGEKLRRAQMAAVALAGAGVVLQLTNGIGIPWLAFLLAATFPSYALLRKISRAKSLPGLAGEAALASVPALAYLVWVEWTGSGAFVHEGASTTALLVGAGVATALPLLLFGYAARRVNLTTLGFTQYLAPSIMFMLDVFAYGKSVAGRMPTFALIWAGLAVLSCDGIVSRPGRERRVEDGSQPGQVSKGGPSSREAVPSGKS